MKSVVIKGSCSLFCANRHLHTLKFAFQCVALGAVLLFSSAFSVFAQSPPALFWSNNVGGKAFAVDGQTNVYVVVSNKVVVLNSAGVSVQTNSICPLPALAQRDASGNYYFFGRFDGTQNFGGITLVGGWTNNSPPYTYQPGWPTCFLAKYASNGVLQWVTSFGLQGVRNYADDFVLNPDGSLTMGYDTVNYGYLALFSASGSNVWQATLWSVPTGGGGYPGAVKVGPINGTNGTYLSYNPNSGFIAGGFYSPSGTITQLTTGPVAFLTTGANSRPLRGTSNDIIIPGLTAPPDFTPILTKWNSQGEEFSETLNTTEPWQLLTDAQANIYIGWSNNLSKYTQNGTVIWTGSYGAGVASMLLDAQGYRYISCFDGTVGKLQTDQVPAPLITNAPLGGEIFAGSNFTFTVGASGYPPLTYYWLYQSNVSVTPALVLAGTNNSLTLSSVAAAQAGLYSVIVSNFVGTVTSTPVALQVQSVAIFNGSQMLTSGTYHFANPPTLSIRSAYTNGEVYYTLDGSTPSFFSTPYAGPFTLPNSATINAIAYSADFSQSAYADTVTAIIPPQFVLTTSTAGGGSISLSPSNSLYPSNTVVTVTATPASGFSFLYWQGSASGTNPVTQVVMNQNQSVTAVFGTTLSTTVAGIGHVYLSPAGGTYPYGTTVRLEAIPAVGNYFGVWGNAASGTTNPLYFTVTNATPTVSSLFAALGTNQSALTVVILGGGKVSVSPAGNVFGTNQTVSITATPNAGQSFLHWGGDASGTANPLNVSMAQSRYIVAHFSGQTLGTAGAFTSQGYKMNLSGDPQSVCQIFSSTNMSSWQNLGFVTNNSGIMVFTDTSATNAPAKFYKVVLTQ